MIKAVLWDIDGTLLNFNKAQYAALYKCFGYFNEYLDDEMVNDYDHINPPLLLFRINRSQAR